MSRRRPRGLSEEDRDIWDRVTAQVTPIAPTRPNTPADKTEVEPERPGPVGTRIPVHHRTVGSRAVQKKSVLDLAPGVQETLARAPVQVHAKTYTRLRRGKLKPEARIDLHGMTLAEAHPVLIGFIQRAYVSEKRLVLVITGKGRERSSDSVIPVRRGLLRHQVPHWLQSGPLAPLVLQITPAHLRHGGDGAYYIYLRRNR